MLKFTRTLMLPVVLFAAASLFAPVQADAKSCFKKAAVGNALTEGLAKFQVDAALLQATDWNIYWTWVASGADDTTVRPRNTKALAEKLGRAGVPVTAKYYPGIGHVGILMALSVPFRKNAAVLDDVTAFIAGG